MQPNIGMGNFAMNSKHYGLQKYRILDNESTKVAQSIITNAQKHYPLTNNIVIADRIKKSPIKRPETSASRPKSKKSPYRNENKETPVNVSKIYKTEAYVNKQTIHGSQTPYVRETNQYSKYIRSSSRNSGSSIRRSQYSQAPDYSYVPKMDMVKSCMYISEPAPKRLQNVLLEKAIEQPRHSGPIFVEERGPRHSEPIIVQSRDSSPKRVEAVSRFDKSVYSKRSKSMIYEQVSSYSPEDNKVIPLMRSTSQIDKTRDASPLNRISLLSSKDTKAPKNIGDLKKAFISSVPFYTKSCLSRSFLYKGEKYFLLENETVTDCIKRTMALALYKKFKMTEHEPKSISGDSLYNVSNSFNTSVKVHQETMTPIKINVIKELDELSYQESLDISNTKDIGKNSAVKILVKKLVKKTKDLMFVVDLGGNLYQYSPTKGTLIHKYEREKFKFRFVVIPPKKNSVFASDHFGNLYEYDLKTQKQIDKITKKNVGRMCASPDGKFLFTSTL